MNALLSITIIGALTLATTWCPARASTQFEHGVIKSITIPAGYKLANAVNEGAARSSMFEGQPGSTITFRTIRKPGRAASAKFASMLKQGPQKLDDKKTSLLESIVSGGSSDVDFPNANNVKTNAEPFKLEQAEVTTLNGRNAIRAYHSSYFYGCSRSAAYNGAYKTQLILVDSSGDGTVIEEVDFSSKTSNFDKLQADANASLQSIKWK
jgi:hypothetical protein